MVCDDTTHLDFVRVVFDLCSHLCLLVHLCLLRKAAPGNTRSTTTGEDRTRPRTQARCKCHALFLWVHWVLPPEAMRDKCLVDVQRA